MWRNTSDWDADIERLMELGESRWGWVRLAVAQNPYTHPSSDDLVTLLTEYAQSDNAFVRFVTLLHPVTPGETTLQNQPIQAPNTEIQTILTNLTPIEIYGYYDAGYGETYQHHIVSVMEESKEEIIAIALQSANMVTVESVNVEYSSNYGNSRKLTQFMNKCLRSPTEYNIGFWDIGYTYEVGQTPAGDWIGITSRCEFEYNP
jgi:hypothetical protein